MDCMNNMCTVCKFRVKLTVNMFTLLVPCHTYAQLNVAPLSVARLSVAAVSLSVTSIYCHPLNCRRLTTVK